MFLLSCTFWRFSLAAISVQVLLIYAILACGSARFSKTRKIFHLAPYAHRICHATSSLGEPAHAGFAALGRLRPLCVLAPLRRRYEMRSELKRMIRVLAIDAALGASVFSATISAANAWGTEGHQVIALIAQSQLTSKARGEVDRLLAQEPGASLASVSTWADEHRNPSTAPWHYVNFPRSDCVYNEQRDCPDGRCVVEAIKRELAMLESSASFEKRLTALKYVVHLVGDVHQPLHAGYLDDKGGNTYQLQAFLRGSNLHAVWDTGLVKNLSEEPEAMAARLQKLSVGVSPVNWDPVNAAEESCRIVSGQGFYPVRLIDLPYIQSFTPVMERRLATAGARLAGILNAALK